MLGMNRISEILKRSSLNRYDPLLDCSLCKETTRHRYHASSRNVYRHCVDLIYECLTCHQLRKYGEE